MTRLALVWTLLIAVTLAVPAQAGVQVLADVPSAGVQRGDRVVGFRGLAASGEWEELASGDPITFQWHWLRCSGYRACRIQIERKGQHLQRPLWIDDVDLAPDELSPAELALLTGDGDTPDDRVALTALAQQWRASQRQRDAAWLSQRRAVAALGRGQVEPALAFEADGLADLSGSPELALQLQLDVTVALLANGHDDLAADRLEALRERELPGAMQVRVARIRASIEFARSQLAEAESILRDVEALARQQVPGSHLLASTLNSLAVVIRPQGRLREARRLFEDALEAARGFESDSVLQAMIRSNLGLLERAAGDLASAERELREVLALLERLQNQPDLTYDTQSNLALVLLDRGRTREAAALWNLQVPTTNDAEAQHRAGRAQQNLALVYAQQGNLHEAVRRLRQALKHWEIAAPDGLDAANARLDLGLYAGLEGDLDGARQVLERALQQHRRIAPDGNGVIGAFDALATVHLQRGALDEALAAQSEAIRLRDGGEQPGWRRDFALTQLGSILLRLGRHEDALAALDEARTLALGAGREAMLASALAVEGDVLLQLGRVPQASAAACAGVEHIEATRGTSPSGAEFRTSFVHAAAPIYRSCLDALLAAGETTAALDLYQSERRLQLYSLIADRDLRFADLPPALVAERGSAMVDLQNVASELESAGDAGTADRAKAQRERVRQRLRRVDERIVEALPRLADWQPQREPAPLRAAAGQVVIAFAVRADHTLRITQWPDQPAQFQRLAVGGPELARSISAWRTAISQRDRVREPVLARQLHAWLLDPDSYAKVDALLIVPDGPLHAMPFVALLDAQHQRLVETHEVSIGALLPGARRPARPAGDIDLLAFADSRASGTRAGLPGVDAELSSLAELTWPRVELLRGNDASAQALHRMGPRARRLHFAVHGVNDPQSPMDSALMLLDAQGRPQPLAVWDIFESLRLQAELVVLAACDTAPGANITDDGWMGLTRAFQFAGAERVISALWPVDDRATAGLMSDFHRRLAQGIDPARALALAQRQMLRSAETATDERTRGVGGLAVAGAQLRDLRQPYYWAGFHLYPAPR